LVLTQDTVNLITIADIDALESVTRVLADFCQGLQIAGVSQLIDIDDRIRSIGDDVTDDCRANEAGAAGN
jgi:hypothetical protein